MTCTNWDINKDMPDLTNKVAIVTGGNTGLGKELVLQLALRNAKVYMASRTESRSQSAIAELKKDHPELVEKANITFLQLDLANLKSCQAAAKEFIGKEERLDILINNAGIMGTPAELTMDGLDIQFQSNYLGHFAFTIPLLPLLVQTSKIPQTSVRIVQVSSMGHNFATGIKDGVKFDTIESVNRDLGGPFRRYGQSKLANVLFAKELARRLKDERIFSSALHPGNITTELNRGTLQSYPWARPFLGVIGFFLVTPYKGAITPLFAATAPEIESNNWRGEYFVPLAKKAEPSTLAKDEKLAKELWEFSERVVIEKTGSL